MVIRSQNVGLFSNDNNIYAPSQPFENSVLKILKGDVFR